MGRSETTAGLVLLLGLWLAGCGGERPKAPARERPVAPPASADTAPALCLGPTHLCFVQPGTGKVLCVGRNLDGQLGDGTGEDRLAFVEARGLRGVSSLSCGEAHTCAVTREGVYCWGRNDDGRLGVGDRVARAFPTRVPGLEDATEVALGDDFGCARLASGRVRCWGEGRSSVLGPGIATRDTPGDVPDVQDVVAISAGEHHVCGRTSAGAVICWGDNDGGQLGRPRGAPLPPALVPGLDGVTQVVAASDSTCVLRRGEVVCFGGGGAVRGIGEAGEGHGHGHEDDDEHAHEGEPSAPRRRPVGAPRPIPALAHVVEIAVAEQHACARLEDGGVRCWGDGSFGRLGDGSSLRSAMPVDVAGLVDARRLVASGMVSCAVRSGDALACWGQNGYGQMGTGERGGHVTPIDSVRNLGAVTPLAVRELDPTGPSAVEIEPMLTAGDEHACALAHDGRVFCWGDGAAGQLGTGSTAAMFPPTPVAHLADAVEVVAGPTHTCARRADGTVVCFGTNDGGLGTGRPTASSRTVVVDGVHDAIGLALGRRFTCILRADHTVACFGSGAYGVLGNGSATPRATAAPVTGLREVAEIVAASAFACARTQRGEVLCWGSNSEGALGTGGLASSLVPTPVLGLRDAVDLSAYDGNVCAVRRSGKVACWGSQRGGAVGNGVSDTRAAVVRPYDVPGIEQAVEVAVGTSTVCVRIRSGAVLCWGGNLFGQAGVEGATVREVLAPSVLDFGAATEPPGSYGPVAGLALGRHFGCALHANGHVSCWGQGPAVTASAYGGVVGNARVTKPRPIPELAL